ncbi:ArnT family glycosyltransferase [Brumimicrobium aurantiacum]|uniref:Glycosyltransferase family 39 protein n=1 Tax=Brumimicrobium aurantiacum TaxID=1737063 RepID=A0A3E1EXB4_9FLAO|nr:glycosyltransferase family 39 protein [Brumimicrobium aurantiacum]RFC54158.1 glycosyltransferase family 39 protein [Brumimicrobium aurantiacum]
MKFNSKNQTYLQYLLLGIIVTIPLFSYLGTLPIRIWDESRLAINAYEMLHNNDYIVTHYEGSPDMWNTKPPLLIWLQVLFMKLIGTNEWAVRLPSAISAFITCCIIFHFSKKKLSYSTLGFIAIIVLITSQGFVGYHSARNGDYDALLTLFTTLSALLFFNICESKKFKHLYWLFLILALAVLSKSISGLLFLPAFFLYALSQKQVLPLLKSKHFYGGALLFCGMIASYYGIRELNNPGYLEAVYQNELGGRYLEVIENHQHGFWYYLKNLTSYRFENWYMLVPFGILFGLLSKDQLIKRLTLFLTLLTMTYFLIISGARTKLEWYDIPMYPFMAILAAIPIYRVYTLLKSTLSNTNKITSKVLPILFFVIVCAIPYHTTFNRINRGTEELWDEEFYSLSNYLQEAVDGEHDLNNKSIVYHGYNAHLLFYVNILNNQSINLKFKDWKNLSAGDVVITNQIDINKNIEENYNHEVLETQGYIKTHIIYGSKD